MSLILRPKFGRPYGGGPTILGQGIRCEEGPLFFTDKVPRMLIIAIMLKYTFSEKIERTDTKENPQMGAYCNK